MKYFKSIIFFLLVSFLYSASIKYDYNFSFNGKDKYINARKGILNKKKYKIKNNRIKTYQNNLKLSMDNTFQRRHFSRDEYIVLNFECIEGPNSGYQLLVSTDINQGSYQVHGWDDEDYVCVIVQNCNATGCSESVGPACIYAGSNDIFCVDDLNDCNNQLIGDPNNDSSIDVIDIIIIVNFILSDDYNFEDCNIIVSDINNDLQINVLDIVDIVNLILSGAAFETNFENQK